MEYELHEAPSKTLEVSNLWLAKLALNCWYRKTPGVDGSCMFAEMKNI